ncbi:MAG TPA: DUF2071 domain-containing protein [Pseudogracilibacillus sp.]|nr:DUF2071 domain-containing protein [Pseudogracilibacillus sp.]
MIEKRKYGKIGRQYWEDIFFLHYEVEKAHLSPLIPTPLQLDTFEGKAWMTIVCFVAKDSQITNVPISLVKRAIQTNVRTYVKVPYSKERGVYFFNLLLNNRFVTEFARAITSLPFQAVKSKLDGDTKKLTFHTKLLRKKASIFHATFERLPRRDCSKLASFLTERYAVWQPCRHRLVKFPIIHRTWELYKAKATVHTQNAHPCLQDKIPSLIHWSKGKQADLFFPEAIARIDLN